MFGPNPLHKIKATSNYSHRDSDFISLYGSIKNALKLKFSLSQYDIILIPGSATLGLEAIISSLKPEVRIINSNGKFNNRWRDIAEKENSIRPKSNKYDPLYLSCSLETSMSELCLTGDILDCVSSFPYYPVPKEARFFVLCGNKQIGAIPGISIVGVRSDSHHLIQENNRFSLLNLYLHWEFSKKNQTLTTASTIVFENLLAKIQNFSMRRSASLINSNSELLSECFGDHVIGEIPCPVITVPKKLISYDIARRWQLYGVNSKSKNYQFFTYSGSSRMYKKFIMEVLSDN